MRDFREALCKDKVSAYTATALIAAIIVLAVEIIKVATRHSIV